MNAFERYCDAVCDYVNRSTKKEKRELHDELYAHLLDHAEALQDAGYTQSEAWERSLRAMGDAKEVGQALNKEYPLLWLILSRFLGVLCGLMIILAILTGTNFLTRVKSSIDARTDPLDHYPSYGVSMNGKSYAPPQTPMDVRIPGPCDDILYIYGVDVIEDESGRWATIAVCIYDESIFGLAGSLYNAELSFVSESGEKVTVYGGKSDTAAAFYYHALLPLGLEDDSFRVCYDRYGFVIDESIDLPTGGDA